MLRHEEKTMRITYFEETDTVSVELSNNPSVETRELNENLYIDLDNEGQVVSIIIEHAWQRADMREFCYQCFPASLES